jgi:hypothetical protein
MKQLSYALFVLLALASCQTIEPVTADQLVPAEMYFPEGLRNVAVVSHPKADATPEPTDSLTKKAGKMWLMGNTATTAEAMAKALADANYFDEVIICDSTVTAPADGDGLLTSEQVTALCSELDADLLLTVDRVDLLTQRRIYAMPELECIRGVADVKVFPTIHAYVAQRQKPLFTIMASDSIYWDEYGLSVQYVATHMAADSLIEREASEFAGSIPMKYLVPQWTTVTRYLYVGGSAASRDAMTYVRQNDWQKAYELWRGEYDTTNKERRKMQAAYNMAIYHEMAGDINEGIKLAEEAQQIAKKIDKADQKIADGATLANPSPYMVATMTNYIRTSIYVDKLKSRKQQLANLKVQMQRFDDDF